MMEGIYASTSALRVITRRVQETSHNLANISTPGFVPRRVEQAEASPYGVTTTGTTPLASGPIVPTGRPLDLALDGGGYFVLQDPTQGTVFTRAGNFGLDQQGRLVDPMGRLVSPGFTVPQGASSIHISPDGQIRALGSDGQVLAQGQLQTASFGNPGGLEPLGDNLFKASNASGPPVLDNPGTAGHGRIVSGALRASGTDIAREMVNLIIDRAAFGANLSVISTESEMLGSIINVVG